MFFGAVVAPGKPTPLVPHADGFALHLSQVALPADVPLKARVSLLVKVGDDEAPVVLCTLTAGVCDTVLLDQFLSEYAELSVSGGGPVHVTGYYSPSYGSPEDEDEDEEDGDYGLPGGSHPLEHLLGLRPDLLAGGEEDEDEDEDDEDEDGSDDDDDLGGGPGQQREPSVIIEDVTEQQPAKAAGKAADGKADKKRKAAEPDGASAKKQAVQPAKEAQKQKKQEQQQPKQQQQQQAQEPKQQKQQQQAKQQKQQDAASPGTAAGVVSAKKGVKRFENGFEVHNVSMGDPHAKLAKAGKVVKVRYTGRLTNGKVFDKTTHKPFSFRLGVGEVIKGWDAGVEGMRVGDKRKLVIPPVMGYGSARTGPIPPNSTLEFDVELVDVK